MKKAISIVLAGLMLFGTAVVPVQAAQQDDSVSAENVISFNTQKALYAHGVLNSADTEAWQAWQCKHDWELNEVDSSVKYFFMPTSASSTQADIYNAFSETVKINGVSIAPGETETVNYNTNTEYTVNAEGSTYTLIFMKSNAEAGIYVNNSDADGNGTDLISYLNVDKSRSAAATGAIVDSEGNVDNTSIKKIKGRGNTTWQKEKKPYNITYSSNVKIAGMNKSKKYCLLANFQDDSLSRNRILYDLSDAVDMPYASDSRYVDFYVNGYYWGAYQLCEKIDAGKNNLVNDIDDEAYLNADGTINEDFPFLCEVDYAANSKDYYVTCDDNIKITIKAPEIDPGEPGYEEVKAYVREKYNTLHRAAADPSRDLSDIIDLESASKLYLIGELGKNWDSGSAYFVWKQDENGNYKFFGSPVWDYDNSLGNAAGIADYLNSIGVYDYTEYTGWWCKYKDKESSAVSTSVMNRFAYNTSVMDTAAQVWFNDFVPALKDFYGETNNGIMKSYKEYLNLLSSSADMNYTSGWLLKTSGWIADHSRLEIANFDENTHKMTVSGIKVYNQNFNDMFMYTVDWMHGRAAWLSEQFYPNWRQPVKLVGDVNLDDSITIDDATFIQMHIASIKTLDDSALCLADVNLDNSVDIMDATYIQYYLANYQNTAYVGQDYSSVKPTQPTTQPSTQPITDGIVYFYNTDGWKEPYAYCWSDSNSSMMDWPGVKMTDVGNGYYSVKIPDAAEKIIFSDNGYPQTSDLFIPSNYNCYSNGMWTAYLPVEQTTSTQQVTTEQPETTQAVTTIPQTTQSTTNPSGDKTVYYYNFENWSEPYVYYWSDSNYSMMDWPGKKMTDIGDGYYSITVPKEAQYIIFSDNGEPQTDDLVIPSGYNCYSNGVWSNYLSASEPITTEPTELTQPTTTEPVTEPVTTEPVTTEPTTAPVTEPNPDDTYVVAGTDNVFGVLWDPLSEENTMEYKDGVYVLVLENVEAVSGQFKIVKNGTDWIGEASGANISFKVNTKGTVIITYNPNTGIILVGGDDVAVVNSIDIEKIEIAGNGDDEWLSGFNWEPDSGVNVMEEISENVYQIVYTGISGNDNAQFKFTANGSWSNNWGGIFTGFDEETDAVYIGENNIVMVIGEGDDDTNTYTLVITLDLTGFDYSSKTGAKFKVTQTVENKSTENKTA